MRSAHAIPAAHSEHPVPPRHGVATVRGRHQSLTLVTRESANGNAARSTYDHENPDQDRDQEPEGQDNSQDDFPSSDGLASGSCRSEGVVRGKSEIIGVVPSWFALGHRGGTVDAKAGEATGGSASRRAWPLKHCEKSRPLTSILLTVATATVTKVGVMFLHEPDEPVWIALFHEGPTRVRSPRSDLSSACRDGTDEWRFHESPSSARHETQKRQAASPRPTVQQNRGGLHLFRSVAGRSG